ncbi:MAG: universal stress protein [Desulfobacterium sp.]|jgi:nucleotide-binding universal stress UspA family protein|nr:universal stress protein [Desulfobacterium sp.]
MKQTTFRVLLAYDGSELAIDATRYVGMVFPPDNTEVVVFYVESKIPRSFWEMEKDLDFRFKTPEIRASMTERYRLVKECVGKAREILESQGFAPESIVTKIHTKEQGVVRDIIQESRQGYDAVVVGRKGFSRLKDLLLGSVPIKLLGKIKSIPLIVVGGIPRHKNVLIAFDGTREVVEAVRVMSRLINTQGYKLLLCHASKTAADLEDKQVLKDNEFFKPSVECLTNAGFTENQLTCELISIDGDLTENIVKRAREGGYESIVIGRRNLTFLEQFFHGRVGGKIFQAAGNQVIWVVQ